MLEKGWIDEFEIKLKSRDVEVMNDDRKVEMKTANKLLMEHAVEHTEAIKVNKEDARKSNKVRKHKRVFFPYELVASIGVTLISCGKDSYEHSSSIFMSSWIK